MPARSSVGGSPAHRKHEVYSAMPKDLPHGDPPPREDWTDAFEEFMGDTRAASQRLLHRYVLSPVWAFRTFLICAVLAAVVAFGVDWPGLEPAAQRALFVLVLAAALWVTEAIPAFAVSLLVIALQIALLGRPGGVWADDPGDWEIFIRPWASPLLWLFFAGFVLAAGAVKTGFDRTMALAILSRIPPRPCWILLAVMGITFTFSMFMSNTATAAMMVAVMGPLVASFEDDDAFGRGLLLGVAFAASLGGMGTLIGTPPNAIAAGALGAGVISFAGWMGAGLPVGVVLAGVVWLYLMLRYPSRKRTIDFGPLRESAAEATPVAYWQVAFVPLVFAVTVGLWLTTAVHGIPSTVVSFVPITAFAVGGILDSDDVRRLPWEVLLLLAGGLSLGVGVSETGLALWLVNLIPIGQLPFWALAVALAYVALWLSNFMSNTAAANILVPLGLAVSGAGHQAELVVPIALAASAAMLLPITTPPNAIVYASGRITARDFVLIGVGLGIVAPPLIVFWCALYF
jgi:solute carrier family 13 (sodium-dependent dicarboxylate transporter), member 2/3/5